MKDNDIFHGDNKKLVARIREFEALLLQSNELFYAIQDELGAVTASAVGVMRGKVFTALNSESGPVVPCQHEWTDDGEFILVCTACGAKEDYTQALQHAFELGGTDDGAYHLEADELCEVLRLHSNRKGD